MYQRGSLYLEVQASFRFRGRSEHEGRVPGDIAHADKAG